MLGCLALASAHPHSRCNNVVIPEFERMSWAALSLSWMNKQACHWLGYCETREAKRGNWVYDSPPHLDQQSYLSPPLSQGARNSSTFWNSGHEDPSSWSKEERLSREIPSYVHEYTPYVHLFSGEQFWPCDMAEHIIHTSPYLNYTLIRNMENDRDLNNLNDLNSYGFFTYLQSEDNVEERPDWLGGNRNIPDKPEEFSSSPARTPEEQPGEPQHRGGYSSAPAILIVVPKDNGIVDAFWFYFYSYNLGNKVLNIRFGNHVGDWEHSMVRFINGTPEAVYISEHGAGAAYAYHAIEKIGKRPVIYSATGTHAIYATPGIHPYILPFGVLHDQTDRGPLWDPNMNHHAFVYNQTSRQLKSSAQTPHAPVNWFYYGGHWGDKIYPMSDSRQYQFVGQYHYVSGPLGPRYKNLRREKVCQRRDTQCIIKHWLGDRDNGDNVSKLPGDETREEVPE